MAKGFAVGALGPLMRGNWRGQRRSDSDVLRGINKSTILALHELLTSAHRNQWYKEEGKFGLSLLQVRFS